MIPDYLKKIARVFIGVKWQDIEYFDTLWEKRIDQMASYIPTDASVLDLGCGKMHLREILGGNKYYPVDYRSRGLGTIICDFNKGEFPELMADVAFVSGCLEYIVDYKSFIRKIAEHCQSCILSYCSIEIISDLKERKGMAWKNHLSESTVVKEFSDCGFLLTEKTTFEQKNLIFVFSKPDYRLAFK